MQLNMKNKEIDKDYKISRIVLTIMTFIIFGIIAFFDGEDWIIISPLFAIIVYYVSFPSLFISKKIINKGN